MKKILKSILVLSLVAATGSASTGAFFTSSVSANDNQIVTGTLRLAIDSTRAHLNAAPYTWNGGNGGAGAPFDAYTVVQDVNGVSTMFNTLETWVNAAPGPAVAYSNTAGADVLPDGNHSYWVAFRNAGTIPIKVSGNVTGGNWTVDPAVQTASGGVCTDAVLNSFSTVSVQHAHIYASNNCEGHEECQNIYFALLTGPWTNATTGAVDVAGPISGPVYGSSNGTTGGTKIQINGQQFIIARVDVNFDNSSVTPGLQNCYQGATFHYNLTGNATQMADPAW